MKKIIWICLLLWLIVYSNVDWFTTPPKEVLSKVRKVADQFERDHWKVMCTLDWEYVELAWVMLGKVKMETSYWTKWVWSRYNNWGNIHKDLVNKAIRTTHADNTKHYPVYDNPEDWLYNLAKQLKNSWCKVTWQSSFNYVKWPKAPRSKANVQWINTYFWEVKATVKWYEKNKWDVPKTTVKWDGKLCFLIKKIKKADYIQLDDGSEFIWKKDTKRWNGSFNIYNCYNR